jgi:hypothetical protein
MPTRRRQPRARRVVPGVTGAPALRGRPITDIAPRLRGLTVTGLAEGRAFTWSATDDTSAVLDACQYLSGGPCVQSAVDGEVLSTFPPALGDHGSWGLFSAASTAAGVEATMSLPVSRGAVNGRTRLIGTINLYAGSADAFSGRRDELVDWSTRWPPIAALGSVSAALADRRDEAARPEPHRDPNAVDWAVATLAVRLGTDAATACDQLRIAACHAGLRESRAAQLLNELLDPL